MAHNVASDQGLHCLLTECSIKICIKGKNPFNNPKNRIRLVQLIIVGNYIRLKWVNEGARTKITTSLNLVQ